MRCFEAEILTSTGHNRKIVPLLIYSGNHQQSKRHSSLSRLDYLSRTQPADGTETPYKHR